MIRVSGKDDLMTTATFMSKTRQSSLTSCLFWTGAKFADKRYGKIGQMGAHRWILQQKVGTLEEGQCALHKCNNGLCVRVDPDHVYLGTQQQNIQDAIDRGTFKFGRGEAHYNAKLTKEQVIDIRTRSWVPSPEMALLYGITNRHVNQIRTGVRWGWMVPNLLEKGKSILMGLFGRGEQAQ